MGSRHGNRLHVQVLFEPFKGDLFLKLAKKFDKKPSVLLRELAYKYIQENVEEAALEEAEAFDKIIRKQAIDARVEGKAKKAWEVLGLDKLTQSEQDIDASNSPM